MSGRFVVGADGALGTILVEALDAMGVKLRHPGPTLDAVVPEIQDAAFVVNAAGPRVRPNLGWDDYMREHVGATTAVVRSMRAGAHLVHVSSAAVYGAQRGVLGPKSPTAPVTFSNPSYAWAKLAGELTARALAREHGVHLTVIRPAMVYGRGVTSAIDTMISLARRRALLALSPGTVKQHCLHVDLLRAAIRRLADHGPLGDDPLPLADPFYFTNAELNEALAAKFGGLKVPVPLGPFESLVRRWPGFPDRDAPGALAAFAFLGLDNEFDWRPLFDGLRLSAADHAKEIAFVRYLQEIA